MDEIETEDVTPVQAEVANEAVARKDGSLPVELGSGKTVYVPLQAIWPKSAMDYMRFGDFDSWAETVLSEDDLDLWDEWMDTNPLMGALNAFFEAVGKATGQVAAGNRALRRSLRNTKAR